MRKVLLFCGIGGPVLYIASDVIASMRLKGYSYVSQVVSELSAVGAPTARFLQATGAVYCLLLIAFGIGVVLSADRSRMLRITGYVIIADAAIAPLGSFVPMTPRGAERALTDVLHLVYVAAIVLLMIAYIAFGAAARGKVFRVYSVATIVAMIVSVVATSLYAPRIAAQLPTPGVGLIERVSVYGPVLWLLVLATDLLRPSKHFLAAFPPLGVRSDRMIRER